MDDRPLVRVRPNETWWRWITTPDDSIRVVHESYHWEIKTPSDSRLDGPDGVCVRISTTHLYWTVEARSLFGVVLDR